jgi:hypothetical protein
MHNLLLVEATWRKEREQHVLLDFLDFLFHHFRTFSSLWNRFWEVPAVKASREPLRLLAHNRQEQLARDLRLLGAQTLDVNLKIKTKRLFLSEMN